MSLQVWLPLTGDLKNQGISSIIPTGSNVTINSTGKVGACYSFNGTSSYIRLNKGVLSSTVKEFSFACWVKLNSISSTMCLFSNRNAGNATGITLFLAGGGQIFFDTGERWTITPTIAIQANTWTHIVFAFKKGVKRAVYINGVQSDLSTYTGTPTSATNTTYSFIGASQNSATNPSANYLNGYLNDVRIYDHYLSIAEIRELARGLVLHYKMGHQNIQPSLLQNGYNFTAENFALTRATVPEQGLLQITPTGSDAHAKYKTGLEYPDANNKRYVVSFDAQEIESTNSSYTTDYIRLSYGFSGPSRENEIIGSADYYTYRNIQLLGTGWQHYVAIFTVPGPLASGDSAAMTDGATLAFQFGRRATKKPIQIRNIKLELDSETIIYDSSGFGHHGETTGEIVYQTDTPRYNTCTHFETTSEKIKISNLPTSDFGDSYTFAWWSKINSINPMQWGFSDGRRLNGLYHAKWWNTGDGNQNPIYVPGTTTQVSDPTLNTWHHWAMTGDGTTCKAYQDGELWGVAKTYKAINGTEIYINGWDSTTDYSSNNLSISDFRIYSTPLDAAAVKELYSLGAKIDKNNNTFTKEFREKPDGINKLYKTAIYETANLIEHESGPSLSPVEWSYQPAANTNNASYGGVYADFSNVKDLGIPITVHCEYDISWNNVAPAAEGTFLARVQGSLAVINGSYDYWQGTNYLLPDSYSMTSDIRNNSTGTKHFSFTKTIPADWFQSYYLARIGFRVNYCDGNGTVSCSNVKITYQFDNTKIHSGAFITNQLIEN